MRNSHSPPLFILCLQVLVRGAKSNPTNWWLFQINAGEVVLHKTGIWGTWKQNGKFWESKAGKYTRQILGLLQTLAHFPYFREAIQGGWIHGKKMLRSAVLQELGETLVEVDLETSVIQPISQKSVSRDYAWWAVMKYWLYTYSLKQSMHIFACIRVHKCTRNTFVPGKIRIACQ